MAPAEEERSIDGRTELATRLHAAAIHVLRRVRRVDPESGVTAARLSALSVVVHVGPLPVGELADREQVSPPTMSRMLTAMEEEDLVQRRPSREDGRVVLVESTSRGRRVLDRARERRVEELAGALTVLSQAEEAAVARAVAILERHTGPDRPASERNG